MAQEIADSTLLDTWGSGGNIVEPDSAKIIEGWQFGEQPPHEYMNWLQNTFGSKLNHILKNGVASWNNETEYLAGSSVQHNGNVWLCKTTNTNSAPTDANANWKRIITVETLKAATMEQLATELTDINVHKRSGSFRVSAIATGNPFSNYCAMVVYGNESNVVSQLITDMITGKSKIRSYNTSWSAWNDVGVNASDILTALKTVDGAGSGLDADLLDGQQGSYYQPVNTAVTTSSSQALHSTDALRISGNTLYLYKGNGANENIAIPNYDLAHSFATSGYQKLSNGFIIQWGYISTGSAGNKTITFPIAFPTACLCPNLSVRNNGAAYEVAIVSFDKTNLTAYQYSTYTGIHWYAIGY